MNFLLKRREYLQDGIFGDLFLQSPVSLAQRVASTLEHAYGQGPVYTPKLPIGVYTCKRGIHKLHGGVPFEAFEIMDVPGHDNILLHPGNYNDDSEGCVLLGKSEVHASGHEMITESKPTFKKFMDLLTGINEFTLTVRG